MSTLSVLVVDDSLIMRRKMTHMLTELGHTVTATAQNGAEAIALCADQPFDLVTMDITMPDMNGIEATRAIIAKRPETLIVMATSLGQETMVMEAIDAGAKGYMLKPVNREKLGTLIQGLNEQYS